MTKGWRKARPEGRQGRLRSPQVRRLALGSCRERGKSGNPVETELSRICREVHGKRSGRGGWSGKGARRSRYSNMRGSRRKAAGWQPERRCWKRWKLRWSGWLRRWRNLPGIWIDALACMRTTSERRWQERAYMGEIPAGAHRKNQIGKAGETSDMAKTIQDGDKGYQRKSGKPARCRQTVGSGLRI